MKILVLCVDVAVLYCIEIAEICLEYNYYLYLIN